MTERPNPDREAPELEPLEPAQEAALIEALVAACRPHDLDAERLEEIVAAALEDPLAEPSAEEIVESDRLRRALEGDGTHPSLALAGALRAAAREPDRASIERALERAAQPHESKAKPGRGNVVYAVFGATGATLALAAALALWVFPSGQRPARPGLAASATPEAGASALAVSRSTTPLFPTQDGFEAGGASARVDRISSVRSRELRANRYALWGVR